jgi:hypothetical protein
LVVDFCRDARQLLFTDACRQRISELAVDPVNRVDLDYSQQKILSARFGHFVQFCHAWTRQCGASFCLELKRLLARMTFCKMSRALPIHINGFGLVLC